VTAEQIRSVAGAVEIFTREELQETPPDALPSPGVGLKHYAPRARLVLVDAPLGEIEARLADSAERWAGERVGVMLPAEIEAPAGVQVFAWGRWDAPEELARALYAGLRALDDRGCTVILCPLPQAEGIGAAIRDRLGKAGNRQ
jgi:L-threonylcarbamoyladenylate synthase